MKILTVVGARPQFIKAAPVQRALDRRDGVSHVLVHTGQHFDSGMSDVFFEELGLHAPDHHLGIRASSHGDMTGRMLVELERVIVEEAPDWVLIYGDTNSTLAAAMGAAKLPVRLAHVEAGLRSFNRAMPEEINRVVADHMSDLCLAPTAVAVANLAAEGISGDKVVLTGDVMFDAVRLFADAAPPIADVLLGEPRGGLIAATVHRAENTDDPERLAAICNALETLADRHSVVLPLHPRTEAALADQGLELDRTRVVPPLGYLEMLALVRAADLVVTDSGGLQKEAFFQRTPCVTVRTETEWVELVQLGWNRLADPASSVAIVAAVEQALDTGVGTDASPYGIGDAADRIVAALLDG